MLEISFAKPALPEDGVLVLPLAEGAELAGPVAALDKALKGGAPACPEGRRVYRQEGATGQAAGAGQV